MSVIILESSHFLYVTTQGHFLDRKRMVWEVMFLSLFYRKHSFRWLLLQWPHWLTACHLDLWAAGKKAGGRLEDKSKTDWGRTDDLPRTMLRGTCSQTAPCPWIGLLDISGSCCSGREHEIWFTSQTLKISNRHEINAVFSTWNKTLYLMQLITVPKAYSYLVTKVGLMELSHMKT